MESRNRFKYLPRKEPGHVLFSRSFSARHLSEDEAAGVSHRPPGGPWSPLGRRIPPRGTAVHGGQPSRRHPKGLSAVPRPLGGRDRTGDQPGRGGSSERGVDPAVRGGTSRGASDPGPPLLRGDEEEPRSGEPPVPPSPGDELSAAPPTGQARGRSHVPQGPPGSEPVPDPLSGARAGKGGLLSAGHPPHRPGGDPQGKRGDRHGHPVSPGGGGEADRGLLRPSGHTGGDPGKRLRDEAVHRHPPPDRHLRGVLPGQDPEGAGGAGARGGGNRICVWRRTCSSPPL